MIISEQTVTDANTGTTLAFRRGVGIGVVDLSTRDGRSSRLHFTLDGEIISIVPNKGLTLVEAAE